LPAVSGESDNLGYIKSLPQMTFQLSYLQTTADRDFKVQRR